MLLLPHSQMTLCFSKLIFLNFLHMSLFLNTFLISEYRKVQYICRKKYLKKMDFGQIFGSTLANAKLYSKFFLHEIKFVS